MQGTVSTANGMTKTHMYYPRPRSFSAGSQSAALASNKRLSTSLSVTPTVKVVRINTSGSKAYGKAKSIEEGKRALTSPTTTSALRYKTELCRPFLDNGFCKYGDKCQFAHGEHDLRSLPRHPKYKTELCRTYHTRGFCPYGSRCHFIHSVDETRKNQLDGSSGGTGGGTGPIKSPSKRTLSFTLPLSPSLDSGISSPDDFQRGRYFDFPGNDHSSGSGSDGDFCDFEQSLEYESCFLPPYNSSGQEIVTSPDAYMELDIFTMGRESPTKPMPVAEKMKMGTEDFPSEVCNMQDLLSHMKIEEHRPTPGSISAHGGCHRLPVFDDILNTKSDSSALLDMKVEAELKSPSKLSRFFNQAV